MINRFGPGKLILLLLILCVAAFAAFDRYNTMLQSKFGRPLVTYALGLAFFLAFLTYYRLLQEYSSSREEGPTLSKRQQCEVTELHNAAAPTVRRGHEVMQFKIAPWPWITQVGAVLRFVSGLALFLGLLSRVRAPLAEWFGGPILLFGLLSIVMFGALFIMNYRIIHFTIGADGCTFRLGPMYRADVKNIISTRTEHFRFLVSRAFGVGSVSRQY